MHIVDPLDASVRGTIQLKPNFPAQFAPMRQPRLHGFPADEAPVGNEHELDLVKQAIVCDYRPNQTNNQVKFRRTGGFAIAGYGNISDCLQGLRNFKPLEKIAV